MRYSNNQEVSGIIKNGFNYQYQFWIKDYIIQSCGHNTDDCSCNGKLYSGQDIRELKQK